MATKPLLRSLNSTIGKKFLAGITGLSLVGFTIIHMLGNLTFMFGGAAAFNTYSHRLISLGPVLWAIELPLLAFFLMHAYTGISVSILNRQARSRGYTNVRNAGGPSHKNASSTSMIYTGIILLVFLVIHLKTFKYGAYYTTNVDGVEMRDLYRLVLEAFSDPLYAFSYVAVMLLLGFHLRHGFWSAFQSLGLNAPRYSQQIYAVGVGIALLLALGFLVVPVYAFYIL